MFTYQVHQYSVARDYFSRYMEIAKISPIMSESDCVIGMLKSFFTHSNIPIELGNTSQVTISKILLTVME